MSTEALAAPAATTTQTAAPGTPGSEPTPLNVTAKTMVSDAFKKAAEPAAAATPKAEAAPAAPKTEAAKPKTEAALPAKIEAAPSEFPEDKITIPANASPEAVKNFAAYKASMKEILTAERARVSAAEAKLKLTTTAAPADAAEQQAQQARLKAAEDRLAILDVQATPQFQQQFVEPKKKALAVVAEVMGYQKDPKATDGLPALMAKPLKDFNAAVSEITEGMNSADAATVATSLREARNLHASEQAALGQANELRSQLQSKTALEQKRAFEAVTAEVTSSLARREITDDLSPEEKEAATAYNQAVDGIRANAEKKAFGRVSERDVAQMAYESETLALMRTHVIPGMEKRFAAQNQVIADLTAQLAAVKGARNPGSLSTDTRPDGGQPKTTRQLVGEAFKGRM